MSWQASSRNCFPGDEAVRPIIEEIGSKIPPHLLFKNIKDLKCSFLLDSATDHRSLGRFSIFSCEPFLIFRAKGDSIALEWEDGRRDSFRSNPFLALKDLIKRYSISNKFRDELPFISGCVGYFSYDMKGFIERLPDRARDDMDIEDAILGFYDAAIIYDKVKEKYFVTSTGLPYPTGGRNEKRKRERLKELKERIFAGSPIEEERGAILRPIALRSNFSPDSYIRAIEKAKEYIKKGDIYQVNLSQRFETEPSMEPFELYLRLREFSPAPFASYLNFGSLKILSSSPERFLLKRGSYIETRPIKGTRPRGEDILSDALLEKELVESRKDHAEHVMIVDLERNDLGRICKYGTVRPSEFIVLERYSTVFHLVSTVAGTLKTDVDPIDCLLATFPGGSITGAPKIRAMEIIDELEPVRRSIYTGAIGYISFDGDMDTSIVIRTFILKDGKAYFSVGGGIVADSDPEDEYCETLDKAKGLMRALQSDTKMREKVCV